MGQCPESTWRTISLIVRSLAPLLTEQACFYQQVIKKIGQIYGDDISCRPVSIGGLQPAFAGSKLSLENRLKNYGKGYAAKWRHALTMRVQNVLGWILMNFRMKVNGVDWGKYKPDLVSNTDFRKFDGILRQVISGTAAQRQQLDSYLQDQFNDKRCVYGIHRSNSALITCLVSNRSGNHYHFVDGADGGYAMAALAMKQQLKALKEQGTPLPA